MRPKLKDTVENIHKLLKGIIILLVDFLEYLKSENIRPISQYTIYEITLKIKHIRVKKDMLGIEK
jgi:hypothetical protein